MLQQVRMQEKMRKLLQLCDEDFQLCSGHMADNDSKAAFTLFDSSYLQGVLSSLTINRSDVLGIVEAVARCEDKRLEKEAAELMLMNLDEPQQLLSELRKIRILENEIVGEDIFTVRALARKLQRSADFLFLLYRHVRGRRQETRHDQLIQDFLSKIQPAAASKLDAGGGGSAKHALQFSDLLHAVGGARLFSAQVPDLPSSTRDTRRSEGNSMMSGARWVGRVSQEEDVFVKQAAELDGLLVAMVSCCCSPMRMTSCQTRTMSGSESLPRQVLEHATASINICGIAVLALKLAHESGLSQASCCHAAPAALRAADGDEQPTWCSLARGCIDLLLLYASSDDAASMQVLRDMELFLQLLGCEHGLPLRVDCLLCLLLRGRHDACVRFGLTVIKRVVALIYRDGKKYPLLKLLLVLLCPQGREIKQNQSRTFNLLKFQQEETLFLPSSDNEALTIQSLCRSRECLAPDDVDSFKRWNKTPLFDPVWNTSPLLDSKLMYTIYSLEVLVECCRGKRNLSMKQQLAGMISTRMCCDIVISKIYVADLKLAVLRFFLHVHLGFQHLDFDASLVRFVEYAGRMLPAVLKHNSSHGFCHPQESLHMSLQIARLLIRALSLVVVLGRVEELASKPLLKFTRCCQGLVTFLWQNQLEGLQVECAELYKGLKEKSSLLNQHTRFLIKTMLHVESMTVDPSAGGCDTYKPRISEFSTLFIDRLARLMAGQDSGRLLEGTENHAHLNFVLKQLRRSTLDPSLHQRLMLVTFRYIEGLQGKELTRNRSGQIVLSLLQLVCSGSNHKQALACLNSLLRRQPSLLLDCERFLRRSDDASVFPTLHAELSRTVLLRQSRGAMEEDLRGSAVGEVLEFVRLVCEGGSAGMQRMFHKQTMRLRSFDVLSEVVNLVAVLSRNLSYTHVGLLSSAVLALRSLIQGPNADNVRLILRSNLFEGINSILDVEDGELAESWGEEGEAFFQVQTGMADLLIVLVEENAASEPQIPSSMSSILNLRGILSYCVRVFRSWEKHQRTEKKRMEGERRGQRTRMEAMLTSGVQYFIFLKDLSLYLQPEEDEIEGLFEEHVQALRFYEERISCVEIVRKLREERVYSITKHFRLPSIAPFVSEEIKGKYGSMLVHEDKMMQLRLLLDCTSDINVEAEMLQQLHSNALSAVFLRFSPYARDVYLINVLVLNLLAFLFFSQKLVVSDASGAPAGFYRPRLLDAARGVMVSLFLHLQMMLELVLCVEACLTTLLLSHRKLAMHGRRFSASPLTSSVSLRPGLLQRMRVFNACNSFQQKHAYWRVLALVLVLYIETSASYQDQSALLLTCLFVLELLVRSHFLQGLARMTWRNAETLSFLGLIALAVCCVFGALLFLLFADRLVVSINLGSGCWQQVRTSWAASAGEGAVIAMLLGLQRADIGRMLEPLAWPAPCPSPVAYGCSCNSSKTAASCLARAEETCQTAAWRKVLAGYSNIGNCGSVFSEKNARIWIFLGVTALYGLVVVFILYCFFAALIIDIYKSLRQSRSLSASLPRDACFICGLHKNSFDPRTARAGEQSFSDHLEWHDKWRYVLFLSRVLEGSKRQQHQHRHRLSASEEFVLGKLQERDISFFPMLSSPVAHRSASSQTRWTVGAHRQLVEEAQAEKNAIASLYRATHALRRKFAGTPRRRARRLVGSGADVSIQDFVPQCVKDVMHAIAISKRYSPFKTFLLPPSRD